METIESCEESLNKLAMTVNQTLIETGRYFRNPNSTQTQLKRSLPRANDELQAALDNLSERIFLAKAVLEKDYEAIRAEEASHEIAIPPPPEPAPIDQPPDTVIVKEEKKEASSPETKQQIPTSSDAAQPAPAATGPEENNMVGSIPPNIPPEPQTASNPMNPATQNNDQDGLNTFDSLLPGLESYANAGGAEDGGMMLQQADTEGENKDSSTEKGQSGQADVQMEDMPPSESNFDNMFVGVGDFGDGEGLLGDIEIGELDDAWFT